MKKSHKIIFSLCAVLMFAFSMFMVNLQPLFAKADSLSTYNVSFVAPDNSILYSIYISSGESLNNIEYNNLVNNISVTQDVNLTSTSSYSYVQGYAPSSDKNLTLRGVATYTYIDDFTFNIKSSSGIFFYRLYDRNSDIIDLSNKTVTFSFYVDGYPNSFTINLGSYSSSGNVWTSNIRNSNGVISQSRPRIYYNATTHVWECGLDLWDNVEHTISKIKLEYGSFSTEYFDSKYISNKLSAYNFSNYYYQYDVDYSAPIISDKYYYPEKFTKQYDTWISKEWEGLSNFNGSMVWTDGVNTYYSNGLYQYVLDITTGTWISKEWGGFSNLVGYNVWTDGTNYYYSNDTDQYVLDTFTSTWNSKTWYGVTSRFEGHSIWTDGTNYYFSYNNEQYILNVSTSTWSNKTWYGITNIFGSNVWTDGTNYYYSSYSNQYLLDITTGTWVSKSWSGLSSFSGINIWFNGVNYCYSDDSQQYVLNSTSTGWILNTWNGLNNFEGRYIWSNSYGIYFSDGSQQYVLASSVVAVDSSYYYQDGYNDGYNNGYYSGYSNGYNLGVDNAGNYTFFSLISAVIDAPLKTITGLFNFELLGVNLLNLFTGLLTLAVLLFVIKLVLGGK